MLHQFSRSVPVSSSPLSSSGVSSLSGAKTSDLVSALSFSLSSSECLLTGLGVSSTTVIEVLSPSGVETESDDCCGVTAGSLAMAPFSLGLWSSVSAASSWETLSSACSTGVLGRGEVRPGLTGADWASVKWSSESEWSAES